MPGRILPQARSPPAIAEVMVTSPTGHTLAGIDASGECST
jgi:hypothetical protein